jgi:hypothetical protein
MLTILLVVNAFVGRNEKAILRPAGEIEATAAESLFDSASDNLVNVP